MLHFCLYDGAATDTTYHDVLRVAEETGMIFARAEYSGSEGCYVEVARWNQEWNEWQRFAFCKVFDGEPEPEKAFARCNWIAAKLNHASGSFPGVRLVATFRNYREERGEKR